MMIYTKLTKQALRLSFSAHRDQTDKSGLPYFCHPFHLAEQMNDEISVCVALLHDVIEDTAATPEALREAGFPQEVVEAVTLLTRPDGMPYLDYVRRIKANPVAVRVKRADLAHNSDLTRLDHIDGAALERTQRYRRAAALLEDDEQLRRISGYEAIMREAEVLLATENRCPEAEQRLREHLDRLEAYYVSDEWKRDFADDEAGRLPQSLKRGVLSEDGIDSLLNHGEANS